MDFLFIVYVENPLVSIADILAMVFLKIYEYIQKAFFLKHPDLTEPN